MKASKIIEPSRTPISELVYYWGRLILPGFSIGMLIAGLTNLDTSRLATMIVCGLTFAYTLVIIVLIENERTRRQIRIQIGNRALDDFASGPFWAQAEQVISDYRKRGSIFDNQVQILFSHTRIMIRIARLFGLSPAQVDEIIKGLLEDIEQKAFDNVIHRPRTIVMFVSDTGRIFMAIGGKDQKERP